MPIGDLIEPQISRMDTDLFLLGDLSQLTGSEIKCFYKFRQFFTCILREYIYIIIIVFCGGLVNGNMLDWAF